MKAAMPAKKLVIFSTPGEAARAQQVILEDIRAANLSDNAVFAIRLSLDEAIANAIRHGNKNDPTKKVQISYGATAEDYRITVTDEGPGFSPERVPDPTLDENLEKPHGRGCMLMHAYMTEVKFSTRGNSVTLIKRRDCTLPNR